MSSERSDRLSHAIVLVAILALVIVLVVHIKSKKSEAKEQPTDAFSIAMENDRDYLIIVNSKHPYIFGGDYDRALKPDLIYVSDCYGELTPIEKGANAAFSLLKQRLHEAGLDIELLSAYRTKEDQEWVVEHYGNREGWAETNLVAQPGFSEHHTGLLINIVVEMSDDKNLGEYIWTTETAERSIDPKFRVIHENLADFGFIDRYPAGKEEITEVPNEPYEIRFVGSSKIAHEIMDNNLCLEEYLEKNK